MRDPADAAEGQQNNVDSVKEQSSQEAMGTQKQEVSAPRVPPNGGLKAWLCVAGGAGCSFCSTGFVNACGIFQLYYETDIIPEKSTSDISWITTVQLFLMFFLGPFVGLLVDHIGPRKVVIPAAVLAILGVCMLSLCTEYYQIFLAQGLCFGIGGAALFLPPVVAVGQWFSTKKGLATSIVVAGSSLGGVILPIMVSRLIDQVGFPAALRWTALLMGIILLISVLCVNAPFPPQGRKKQDSGGLKDMMTLPWLLFCIGCFFVVWGLYTPFNYLPLSIQLQNPSDPMVVYIASIVNAASLPGRILPGFLSDRVGQLNTMLTVGLCSGISMLVYWLPLSIYSTSEAGIIVFGILYGFLSGGYISLQTPCVIVLNDGKTDGLGLKLGAFMMVVALGSLSGLPIAGAILDAGNGFAGVIGFSGAAMVLGGLFLVAARISKGGANFRKM